MKNICRPFTLYSDFLPSASECRKWGYLAFGYYDGVDVGKNLFSDGKWDLEQMWNYTEEQKQILDGSYIEQTIFGFRAEEDETFWENDEERNRYPFLLLTSAEFYT